MSRRHEKLKRQAAKKRGKTETPVKVGRKRGRIDVITLKKAIEIERSGNADRIEWALKKLSKSRKPIKILKVNRRYIPKARSIKRKLKLRGIKIVKLTSVV